MPNVFQTSTVPAEGSLEQYRNGVLVSKTSNLLTATTIAQFRNSVNTPGFRRRVLLPENPFTYTETRTTFPYGTYRLDNTSLSFRSYWNITRGVHPGGLPSIVDFSVLEKSQFSSMMTNKLLLKVKDQKVNVAQFFGESPQLLRMLGTNINRIGQAYAALKHGDISKAARALGVVPPGGGTYAKRFAKNQHRAVARGWLELQYGWLPLISDCYGAVLQISKHFRKQMPVMKASVRSQIIKSDRSVTSTTYYDYLLETSARYELSARCNFRLSQPVLKELSELGITNPALLAWELAPYSFVVDWFIPIGSFLSALDATFGVEFVSGSVTTFDRATATGTKFGNGKKFYTAGWYHYRSESGQVSAQRETVACSRGPLLAFPFATLPSFKNPLSTTHALNALALLHKSKRS